MSSVPTNEPTNRKAQTVIVKGVVVEGDFKSDGDVTIEGDLKGTLNVSGRLTVGSEAAISATITVKDAQIAGKIEGNIKSSGDVELLSSAKVKGDIQCAALTIQRGAVLDGKVSVVTSGSSLVL